MDNNYMEEKSKKIGKTGIVVLVILLLLAALVAGVFFGPKFIESDTTKQLKKEVAELKKENNKLKAEEKADDMDEKEKVDKNEVAESSKLVSPKCYGTYVASTNSKIKYVLKEDGSFAVEGIDRNGYFVINDNTISLISQKHTAGPKEEDPYYTTSDYVISDDCSTIKVVPNHDNSENYILKKQA